MLNIYEVLIATETLVAGKAINFLDLRVVAPDEEAVQAWASAKYPGSFRLIREKEPVDLLLTGPNASVTAKTMYTAPASVN